MTVAGCQYKKMPKNVADLIRTDRPNGSAILLLTRRRSDENLHRACDAAFRPVGMLQYRLLVTVPPKMDLKPYGTLGIIEFRSNSDQAISPLRHPAIPRAGARRLSVDTHP